MAKTSLPRAWFFPTSPRSPYKLQGELRLLKQLEGKPWNPATQLEFAELLKSHSDFEGHISDKDPAFSARDRVTRAPRLLGLVHLPQRGRRGPLRFTDAGNLFLTLDETLQTPFLQRQIAKVQFGSPLHRQGGFEKMSVKPLGVMIEMLRELGKMTKDEVAMFGVTTITEAMLPEQIAAAKAYRSQAGAMSIGERKKFRHEHARGVVRRVYAEDIKAGNTKLREGGKDFVETKWRTLRDYADASIRYLLATGLFTVTPHGQSLGLSRTREDEALFLLGNHGHGLSKAIDADYDDYVQGYLGNPSLPQIRQDLPELQDTHFESLTKMLGQESHARISDHRQAYASADTPSAKIAVIHQLESEVIRQHLADEAESLRSRQSDSADDIETVYQQISSRHAEIIDRPLMYEWNTWRAMVLINDARAVSGNYSVDADGHPLTTAPGNRPDVIVEYETFHLAVEVTLSSGQKQYEMEGEPVTRHVGQLQKSMSSSGDPRPVYGMIIAETINETVASHLLSVSRYPNKVYAGPVRVVPLDRKTFCRLMQSSTNRPGFNHHLLRSFFESVFSHEAIALDEVEWRNHIHQEIEHIRQGA